MLSVIVSKCKRIHTSFLQLLAWANRLIPGSYTFFRAKVKGLFKDFPGGPHFHTFVHVSIFRILHSLYLNTCFHWPSFTSKLTRVNMFLILLNKKSKNFQGPKTSFKNFSRPWNHSPEIQGFSRVLEMHIWTLLVVGKRTDIMQTGYQAKQPVSPSVTPLNFLIV